MAEDDVEADLGVGLVAKHGAPPRLWRQRIGGLPLADGADGGGTTGSVAAIEALEASPLKSWAPLVSPFHLSQQCAPPRVRT